MNGFRFSVLALALALFVSVGACATDIQAPTTPEADAGVSPTPPADAGPAPTDSGPPPPTDTGVQPPVDSGNPPPPPPPPADAGTPAPPPPADAGISPMPPAPTHDEWRLVYRAPSGVTVSAIDAREFWNGSVQPCTLSRLDPEQGGTPLTNTIRCPVMRFPVGATLRFNARFTLPPTSGTAPMPLETWACHTTREGGPMESFGTVEATRNGVPVPLRRVENMRGGCNLAPAL